MAPQYPAVLPDYEYWKNQQRCQQGCPAGTDAGGYVRALARGDLLEAWRIARSVNPLASICGRICGAPCEQSCRRGSLDEPVGIRAIKRSIWERISTLIPSEGESYLAFIEKELKPRLEGGIDEISHLLHAREDGSFLPGSSERVAIIGSGPAGLACAHDLALMGFKPVIFEMEPVPAGMLYLGVPEYRLPRSIIRAEVDLIRMMGVEVRCNVAVGRDITFGQLREEFRAVVIAIGAKSSRELNIKGFHGPGVPGGVEFLRDVALGNPVRLGERVIVIGGGNVAYDVSRTVIRQTSHDISRTAKRQASVKEVHLCYRKTLEEMPADEIEIEQGGEEGVMLHTSLSPLEIMRNEEGRVTGVLFQNIKTVYDKAGKASHMSDPGSTTVLPADSVIFCVGQKSDFSFIDSEKDGIELTSSGLLRVSSDTLETTSPGIFAAGDVSHGTLLLIDAVASGKKAARSVYSWIMGRSLEIEKIGFFEPIRHYSRERSYESLARTAIQASDVKTRLEKGNMEVELGFKNEEVSSECARCLECNINTVFDSEKCLLCGGCVDVCPVSCLRLVPLSSIAAGGDLEAYLREKVENSSEEFSVLLKDEAICIRCGLCAQRCPNGAISMEKFHFREAPRWKS